MENIQCPSCGSSSFTKQGELIECNHCGNIYQPVQLQPKVQTAAADTESVPDDPLEELQDERTIKQLIHEVEELEQEFQDKSEEYERLKKPKLINKDNTEYTITDYIALCIILVLFYLLKFGFN